MTPKITEVNTVLNNSHEELNSMKNSQTIQ